MAMLVQPSFSSPINLKPPWDQSGQSAFINKKLAWIKVANWGFKFLINKNLPGTKAANWVFKFLINKKLAWTKVANWVFKFFDQQKPPWDQSGQLGF